MFKRFTLNSTTLKPLTGAVNKVNNVDYLIIMAPVKRWNLLCNN